MCVCVCMYVSCEHFSSNVLSCNRACIGCTTSKQENWSHNAIARLNFRFIQLI